MSTPAFWSWPVPDPLPLLPDDARPSVQRVREVLARWQAGRCAVCGGALGVQPIVDHCHRTNRVRGLLCGSCNTREGVDHTDPVLRAYRAAPPTQRLGLDVPYEDGAPVWLDAGDGPPMGSVLAEDSPWWHRHAEAGVPGAYQARAPWRYPEELPLAEDAVARLLSGRNRRDRDALTVLAHLARTPGRVVGGEELTRLCDGPVHAVWAATADAVGTRAGAPPLHRKWNVSGRDGGVRYALRPSTCTLLIEAGLPLDARPSTPPVTAVPTREPTPTPGHETAPRPTARADDGADVDDPVHGALVPTSRSQLAAFAAPEAMVTLDDGSTVAVRRHRDALNHLRRPPSSLPVRWAVAAKGWARWREAVQPTTDREREVVASLDADAAAGLSSVGLETSDPADLRALADVLDAARRTLWSATTTRSRDRAREVAVFVGALRVLAGEAEPLVAGRRLADG